MEEELNPEHRESRHFLRGIASKLVFAVLGAVIIPFLGLVLIIDNQIKNLREIAFNFFEFTGGRRSVIKKYYLGTIIIEVLELNKG